jgi:hypothetical protein
MNKDQEVNKWLKESQTNDIVVYVNNPGEFAVLADPADAHTIQTLQRRNIDVKLITINGVSPNIIQASNVVNSNRNITALGGVTINNVITYSQLPQVMYVKYNNQELLRYVGKNPSNFTVNFQNIDGAVVRLQLRELTGIQVSNRTEFNNAAIQNAQAQGNSKNVDYDAAPTNGNPLFSLRVRPNNALLADMAARFQAKMTPVDYNTFMSNVQRGGTLVPGKVDMNNATVAFIVGGKKFSQEFLTRSLIITNGPYKDETLAKYLQAEKANLDKFKSDVAAAKPGFMENLKNRGKNLLDITGRNRYASIEQWIDA